MPALVHQLLHGYRQGHNLLSSSISLDLEDAQRMAMLSDWSEYTNERDDDSYITAYPLLHKPYYVIAKTWYAGEMERPGCVWTHSLLISNADLVKVKDFRFLLGLFKRPVCGEYGSYTDAIERENFEVYDFSLDEQYENSVVEIIYDRIIHSKSQVYRVEMESQWYQKLALHLMNYLPPRLLAKMSFSTGCSYIRSIDNKPFDVQFVSGRPDIESVFLSKSTVPPWINFAGKKICENNLLFGQLIKMFSDDLADNREKLNIYWLLIAIINQSYPDEDRKKVAIATIFSQLARAFPDKDQGRLMKERFMQVDMTRNFADDVVMTAMLCSDKNITAYHKIDVDFQKRVDTIVASKDKTQIGGLILKLTTEETNEWGKDLLSQADRYLSNDIVDTFAQQSWPTLEILFGHCPSILNNVNWADVKREQLEVTSNFIAKTPEKFTHWEEYTISVLKAKALLNRNNWNVIFSHNSCTTALFLDYYNSDATNEIMPIHISILSAHKAEVLAWMKRCTAMNALLPELVMQLIPPSSTEARNSDIDCWQSFAKAVVKPQSAMWYSAYLYVLSFNWQSNDAATDMLKKSFYPLYKAAADSRLDEGIWQSVSPYTEELPIWFAWDKCKKMRKKVGRRLAAANVSREYVSLFTPDRILNGQLINTWERNK